MFLNAEIVSLFQKNEFKKQFSEFKNHFTEIKKEKTDPETAIDYLLK